MEKIIEAAAETVFYDLMADGVAASKAVEWIDILLHKYRAPDHPSPPHEAKQMLRALEALKRKVQGCEGGASTKQAANTNTNHAGQGEHSPGAALLVTPPKSPSLDGMKKRKRADEEEPTTITATTDLEPCRPAPKKRLVMFERPRVVVEDSEENDDTTTTDEEEC